MSDGIEAFGYRVRVDRQSVKAAGLMVAFAAVVVFVPLGVGWAMYDFEIPHYTGLEGVWLVGFMTTALTIAALYVVYGFLDEMLIVEVIDDE